MKQVAPPGDNSIDNRTSAAPLNPSAKNDHGRDGKSSELPGKKKVCTCPGSRDDTSVAVCQDDKKYLVDLAAETSRRTGRQVTVKETLAGIINNNRERASA